MKDKAIKTTDVAQSSLDKAGSAAVQPSSTRLPPLSDLLPHGPPMLLLTELVDAGADFAVARIRITRDSLFYQPGRGVPGWISLEYMAQAVGIVAGMQAHLGNWALTSGFLLGSRRLRCSVPWFTDGMVLTASGVEEMMADNGMGSFKCKLCLDDNPEPIADCRVTIYRNPPDHMTSSA